MVKAAQRELKPIQGCSGRRRRSTVALVSPASLCPPLSSMVEPNPKKELMGHRAWEMRFSVILLMAEDTGMNLRGKRQTVGWASNHSSTRWDYKLAGLWLDNKLRDRHPQDPVNRGSFANFCSHIFLLCHSSWCIHCLFTLISYVFKDVLFSEFLFSICNL